MATTVAQMTTDELKELIGAIIEQNLLELLGDPDEGLVMTKTLRNRLLRQKRRLAKGNEVSCLETL